jgi:hypothetical protein
MNMVKNKIYTASELREISKTIGNTKKDESEPLKDLTRYLCICAINGYTNCTFFTYNNDYYNNSLKYEEALRDLGYKIIKVISNDKIHHIIISWEE